ncbi:hypothetical protein EUGRSUZ_D02654 [Eucalyptus grandis]|nr:hypothetical protein EUGRSUZ_D02654 [Eucalyptus grandis]
MARGLPQKEEKEARKSRLQLAIANDDVDEVHNLIGEEQQLLDRLSKDPFPNTPLHLAAAAGKTQVAMEIAILKPSFTRKLNLEGYSPMHLALQNEHYNIVRALMNRDPKLIRVSGRCGITPLHYVAGKEGDDELEILVEFLCTCKSSIEDLTSRRETAVHIAIKKDNLEAFKVLFGWLQRVHLTEILHWKDEDGNNVLDIAKSKELTEISDLLSRHRITDLLIGYVNLKEKDFRDKTTREVSQGNPSGDQDLAEESRPPTLSLSLSHFLRRELTCFEKYAMCFGLNESAREIILVVATLITTATYQAAVTPPGGYWGDNSSNPPANFTVVTANSSGIAVGKPHQAGDVIMSGKYLYPFTALNGMVFLLSVITIWSTAIPLLPHTIPVYLLVLLLSGTFLATATIGFPESDAVAAGTIEILCMSLLLVVLAVPTYFWYSNTTNERERERERCNMSVVLKKNPMLDNCYNVE